MNFERSPFFIPWAPRNVRRVRSVSFETLMLQRTASSSICYHLYAQIDKRSNVYTPNICQDSTAENSINAARENLRTRRRISLDMINWREPPVPLTIDLPDAEVTALAAKARARGVSAEEYARQ